MCKGFQQKTAKRQKHLDTEEEGCGEMGARMRGDMKQSGEDLRDGWGQRTMERRD